MEFIIGLRKHNLFGFTASTYWIERDSKNNNFYKIIQNILIDDISKNPNLYSETQTEIVRLVNSISEQSIYRKFLKIRNNSITEFYNDIDKEYLEKNILPYVGNTIYKILKIVYRNNIKIFLKSYRYKKVFVDDQLFFIYEEIEPIFKFSLKQNTLKYELKLFHRGIAINLKEKEIIFISNYPCIFLLDNRIYHSHKLNCKKIYPFLSKDYIIINSNIETYLKTFVKKLLLNNQKVIANGFEIKELQTNKKVVLTLEKILNTKWGFSLKFFYNEKSFSPNNKKHTFIELKKQNGHFIFYKITRDLSWEENIIYALKRKGLRPYSSDGFFIVPCSEDCSDNLFTHTIRWLNENSEILNNLNIEIIQHTEKKYFTDKIKIEFKVNKKIDWFDLNANVKFGDIEIPFLELKEHILNRQREIVLPDGQTAIIPEHWFEQYKNLMLFAKKGKDKKHILLNKSHFTILSDIYPQRIKKSDIQKFILSLQKQNWKIPELPNSVNVKLRNYQKKGYAWLYNLCKHGFGGCLADDMGLGKTIQTIVAIAKALEETEKKQSIKIQQKNEQNINLFAKNGSHLISLIIAPKSLIYNWINEFKKFAPTFKLINYTGTNRFKIRDQLINYDIILTSYGIARNDIDFLLKFNFFYVVLDESQYIKNPNSKIFQAVLKLKSKHRLILTGTPIENSLSELWAQMSFVNPGLLGSYNFFKKHFINPIEKENSLSAKKELKRLIGPFLLRRTKNEVVKDLPQLIEQTIYCEMTDDQTVIYETEKSKIRNELLKVYEQGKLNEYKIIVLSALTRLRQIANHPRIILNENISSGKFEIIIDKINTVLQEGHKLLLFSSFVKHLEIYKEYFDKHNLKYVILTGEVDRRKEIINQFQQDKDTKLFLISLKAGGVGLNLTAADYVFILDPWWNPAAEQQAISRAHRIGQNRTVIVYKFISLGTVEEKIKHLQEKKSELFTEFVESANFLSSLTEDNIIELLK